MKALLTASALLPLACGAGEAADYGRAPTTMDVVVPLGAPAEPPRAMVVQKLTMFSLLNGGWQPVDAALIPESGIPGTKGSFAHADGAAVKLYKNGVYAYCGIAQVGGAYNDCHIVSPGSR